MRNSISTHSFWVTFIFQQLSFSLSTKFLFSHLTDNLIGQLKLVSLEKSSIHLEIWNKNIKIYLCIFFKIKANKLLLED